MISHIAAKRFLLGTLIAMAMSVTAWAAAPDLITYQGRLLQSGSLVNGNRSVEIRLCDAVIAGNCYLTGAQGVAVSNGIFRTTFTAASVPSPGFESGTWFIEVVVDGNVMSPREQLGSMPYALVATSVAASGIRPGVMGTGVHFAGSVGIGTTAPDTSFRIHAVQNVGKTSAGFNDVAVFTSNDAVSPLGLAISFLGSATPSDRASRIESSEVGLISRNLLLQTNAGNVGIGMTNPGAKLQVAGTTILGASGTSIAQLLHGTCSPAININSGLTQVVSCTASGVSSTDRVFLNVTSGISGAILESASPTTGAINVTFRNVITGSTNGTENINWMAISP